MRWREFSRQMIGIVVLVVALSFVAVAVRGQAPNSEPLRPGIEPTVPPTPTATPVAVTPLPGGASPDSALVMIQGIVERKLVVWPLDEGGAPREVDRGVALWPLIPDPAGTQVIYRTTNALMALDVSAGRSLIVAELDTDDLILAVQWSPDGAALAFVVETGGVQTAYYMPRDTRDLTAMLQAPAGLPVDVAWLDDGRPAAVVMGIGPVGGLQANPMLYDPVTGERRALSPDVALVQPYAPWRSPDGQHQLYALASSDKVQSSVCRTAGLGLADDGWVYLEITGTSLLRTIAFEIRNMILDLAVWLPDGRVVMRAIADEGCAPGATGIYVARLGEQPRQLVATGPFVTRDDNDIVWGASFDLSPDRTQVAWVKNDVEARQASVYLTPVDGGETSLLFAAPAPPNGAFTFEDTAAILDFLWLP
ncbi:hypothetical protein [Aggregatilinea lenta]|uniref:hypothetical protein n=1 Tax=Aggregatilinea lenta TaxID=913108 RepID=UPI000E5BBC30|nr:hypothetical protein [Aggregatilinea lenta]